MAENPTVAAVRQATETKLKDKLATVAKVAESQVRVADLARQLADAEREHAANWSAAMRDGWSARDLKDVGLNEPGRRSPGRPRKTRKRTTLGEGDEASAERTFDAAEQSSGIDQP